MPSHSLCNKQACASAPTCRSFTQALRQRDELTGQTSWRRTHRHGPATWWPSTCQPLPRNHEFAQILLRPVFDDVREYTRTTPRDEPSDWSRTELWDELTTTFDFPNLPPGISISDGTGDKAIGCCQLDGTSIGRLHAGDSSRAVGLLEWPSGTLLCLVVCC